MAEGQLPSETFHKYRYESHPNPNPEVCDAALKGLLYQEKWNMGQLAQNKL